MSDAVEDRLQELLQRSTTAGPDRAQAESELMGLIGTEPKTVIFASTNLIQREGVPEDVIYKALVAIKMCLMPGPRAPVHLIRQKWMEVSQEQRNAVKSALVRGIMFTKLAVVNTAALCIGVLVNVEGTEALPVVSGLADVIDGDGYSQLTKTGAFCTISEICETPFVKCSGEDRAVIDVLRMVIQKFKGWIRVLGTPGIEHDLQLTLLMALRAVIKASRACVVEDREMMPQLIAPLLQFLRNPSITKALFQKALKAIFTYVKVAYDSDDFDFGPIGENLVAWVQNARDVKAVGILHFWIDLAKFEYKRKTSHEKYAEFKKIERDIVGAMAQNAPLERAERILKPKLYREFSKRAGQQLSRKALEFLEMINETDTDEEETCVIDTQFHVLGTVVLQWWFRLYPEQVLNEVVSYWEYKGQGGSIERLPWMQEHALILAAMSVIDDKVRAQCVRDFLVRKEIQGVSGNALLFIASRMNSPIPKVQDTALYTLGRAIQYYKVATGSSEITAVVSHMVTLLKSNPRVLIVQRIFHVVIDFIRVSDSRTVSHFFDSFANFWLFCSSREDLYSTDMWSTGARMLTFLFMRSTTNEKEKIQRYVQQAIEGLEQEQRSDISGPRLSMVSSKLWIIGSGFARFKDDFGDMAERFARSLFRMLQQTQSLIWEEALDTLFRVIHSLGGSATRLYDGSNIRGLVSVGLRSQNETIIANTIASLGEFYQTILGDTNRNSSPAAQDLQDLLPQTFQLIDELINNPNFTPGFKAKAMDGLTKVIKGGGRRVSPDIRTRLYEMYRQLLKETPFEHLKKSGREHATHVAEVVLNGYGAILETMPDDDPMKSDRDGRTFRRNWMREISDKMLELDPKAFNKAMIVAVTSFLHAWNNCFGRSANILLNRRQNYELLALCMVFAPDEATQKCVMETVKMVAKA